MSDEIASQAIAGRDDAPPRLRRRIVRRMLKGAGVTFGLLLAVGGFLYAFGTMQPPSAEARAQYGRAVTDGSAPAVQARFGIPIPGCVCHTDDAAMQVQHSSYYIRDCKGCHSR